MIAAANVQVVHIRPVAQTGPGEKKQVVAAATEIFDEEDKGFEVVEENTVLKKKQNRGAQSGYSNPRGGRGGYFQRGGANFRGQGRGGRGQQPHWQRQNEVGGFIHQFGKKGFREASIEIRGDWPVIAELSKNQLDKLNPIAPTLREIVTTAGEIPQYNKENDRARTQRPITINKTEAEVFNVQTLSDPIFQRLAKENKADIFATELAASAIMTAPKSLYSWDVVIKRYQDKIFIDKRDDQNMLDFLTVNETSNDNQPQDEDNINGVRQLM